MYVPLPNLGGFYISTGAGFVVWALTIVLLPFLVKTKIGAIVGLIIALILGAYLYIRIGNVLMEPLLTGSISSGSLTVLLTIGIWAVAALLTSLFVSDTKAMFIVALVLLIIGISLYVRLGTSMSLPLFGGSIPTGTPLPTPTPTPGGMPTN